MENSPHPILAHSDLIPIDEKLWIVKGELPHHNPLPRTMTVYKMRDGGLWIHSAIALNDETQNKLEELGTPKYLVVPNTMHRLDAALYKRTYPHILVVCPLAAIEKVQQEVPVDLSCEEAFAQTEIKVVKIPGAKDIELAYEISLSYGQALIMTDLLVNVPEVPGLGGVLLKLIGRIGFFRTPPLTKILLLQKREAFKNWLLYLSQRNDLKIITMAHGQPLTRNISHLLKQAAAQV